jgi:hypothetical protein
MVERPPNLSSHSVPLAACETAEGDQPDQGDDQPDPKAPDEHQDDPDDDDDAAEGYACDSTAIIRSSHAFLLPVPSPRSVLLEPSSSYRTGPAVLTRRYSRRPTASRAASGSLWLVTRQIRPKRSSKTNPAIESMSTVLARPRALTRPITATRSPRL